MNISKYRQKLAVIAMAFLMTIAFLSVPAFAANGTMSGEGTEASPYLVEDAADFAAMGTTGYYQLAGDITISEVWGPNNDMSFQGTFDGAGHTITANNTMGVFFKTGGNCLIKDLIVAGTIKNTTTTAIGGVVNTANDNTEILRCVNKASIDSSKTRTGGIVGVSNGTTNYTKISYCVNLGNISGSAKSAYAGGIDAYNGAYNQIDHCYNMGEINLTGSTSRAGGVVANTSSTNGTITNCYNAGALTAKTVGGLFGWHNSSAANCYTAGEYELVGGGSGALTDCAKVADAAALLDALDDEYVADTDNINGGFPILAWQAAGGEEEDVEANLAAVNAAKKAYDDELGALKPSFKTDQNIVDLVQAKVDAYEGCEGVTVSLKSSDEPEWIKEDGTIVYRQKELDSFGLNSKNVECIFTFTKGTQSVETGARNAIVGWNQEYYSGKIAEEADGLTAEQIKGANAALDEVTENLTLPQIMTSSSRTAWSKITWTSSNEDVIKIDKTGYDGITDPKQGTVTRPAEDTVVTLTATFNVNSDNINTNVEKAADFTPVVKTFDVTVKKTEVHIPTEEELQAILDQYYTADRLTDSVTGETLDTAAVTGDIQLPRYTQIKDADNNLVFENKEITVTSDNEDLVKINGYRAAVDRFAVSEDTVVNLTISYKKLDQDITVTKQIPLTVKAITETEVADELAMMDKAKAAVEAAILDGQDKDAVTENLHAFQEIYLDEDGNAKVAYATTEVTGNGIKADGYWGSGQSEEMEASGYNRFKSSDPAILQHENLVLAQQPESNTEVTITCWLSSAKYGEAAENHPDNEVLKALYKQEVSTTVTIKGSKAAADALASAIAAAQEFSDGITEGEEAGQYPAGTKDTLNAAIADAQAVLDKTDATEDEQTAAITALNAAVKVAKETIISPEEVEIDFSFAMKGDLVVVNKPVTVTDSDKDGTLTINDALIEAHRAYAPNGVDDYAYGDSQWGLAVKKLWGDTSNNFGYYVNDQMAMNAADPIADGDLLYAWVYKSADWKDVYSYFDEKDWECLEEDEVELQLTYNGGWDENGNPVFKPLAGASVGYYDGDEFVKLGTTDEDGLVLFAAPTGSHVITAIPPEDVILVPPYCVLSADTKDSALEAAKQFAIETLEKQIEELKNDENEDELDAILMLAEKEINGVDSFDDLDVIAAIVTKTAAEIDRAASASLEEEKAAARQALLTQLKDAIDAGKLDPAKGITEFLNAVEAIDAAKSSAEIEAAQANGAAAFNKLVEEKAAADAAAASTAGKKKAKVVKGKTYKVKGQSFKVTKVAKGKKVGYVTFTKAKNAKSVTVPATVKLADKKTYKVNVVGAKAFTAKKIRTVTVGANVTKLTKNAFAKSKATKVTLKTKKLKKSTVKGSLKGSKVKTIKVKAGKKVVKKYKKIFTKKNAGKKVKVK